MRKLIASTFLSLDGILQGPGGPTEDVTGNFKLGGWMAGLHDESMDIFDWGFAGRGRELLLGRRTYEIFEGYWPFQSADNPIAKQFNATQKHVASRTRTSLNWENSQLLKGDVADAVKALKQSPGLDLQIIGSGNLIQTLQAAGLIDEFNIWTFPVLLGHGKKLFGETIQPAALKLTRSVTSSTGVVMSTYVPGGDVHTGSIGEDKPGSLELDRRRKMAEGTW